MKQHNYQKKYFKSIHWFLSFLISLQLIVVPEFVHAQPFLGLPQPGVMVTLSPAFQPVTLYGMKVNPLNPFEMTFILDSRDQELTTEEIHHETKELIRYFLACLTIPEKDLWVNLSPYEQERIIPSNLEKTPVGRDLLAQDYLLKQITASLIYPETELGQAFWSRVYKKAFEQYGTTDIPVDIFHKVWIMPDRAVVYETEFGAFIDQTRLKVVLDEDHIAMAKKKMESGALDQDTFSLAQRIDNNKEGQAAASSASLATQVLREVVLPELEKEVNEGRHFAKIRQIFHALTLAAWFKKSLRSSIINSIYSDQGKVEGITIEEQDISQKVYDLYLQALQKGVYDYIKVEHDPLAQKHIPRKYFSGGFFASDSEQWLEKKDFAMSSTLAYQASRPFEASVQLTPKKGHQTFFKRKFKGLTRYLLPAVLCVVLGVSASFNNLFAGTNEIVGPHGHRFETAQDGGQYVVVRDSWSQNPDQARYTFSGLAADVLSKADDLGIEIDKDAKIYWDIVETLAAYNNVSGPGYVMRQGDTIRIAPRIAALSKGAQETSPVKSVQVPVEQGPGLLSGQREPAEDLQAAQDSLSGSENVFIQPTPSAPLAEPREATGAREEEASILNQADAQKQTLDTLEISYEMLYHQAQEQIEALAQEIDDLKKELAQTLEKEALDPEAIDNLQSQIEDLEKKKFKLEWSFARKVETELKVKEDDKYFVAKPGDLTLTVKGKTRISDFMLQGKLKYNGSLRYGKDLQPSDLQRQLCVRMDNLFGQPYWIAGTFNWDNQADPTGIGIGVRSWKFGDISVSPQLWYYEAKTTKEFSQENISVSVFERHSSWLPELRVSYAGGFAGGGKGGKGNEKISATIQGFFSRDPVSYQPDEDLQYSLRYDNKDFYVELIKGFQNPRHITYLTRLSQEPGPYRLSLGKNFKVQGQKIGLSGYWAFDQNLKTTGGKLYLSTSGPLNYGTWQTHNSLSHAPGPFFRTTTDISTFALPRGSEPQISTTGDIELGVNLGSVYIGLVGDYFLSGQDLGRLTGRFSTMALEAEHFISLDTEDDISYGIHYGLRRGRPTAGISLSLEEPNVFLDMTGWSVMAQGQPSFAAQLDGQASFTLEQNLFLNFYPTLIYSQESSRIAGSLDLMYKNFGIEFSKPFKPENNIAYQMGYLPYPYNYRVGPRVDFQNFSGSAYYGQGHDGNPVVGVRVGYGINQKQKAIKKSSLKTQGPDFGASAGSPPKPAVSKDGAMASSPFLLSQKILFMTESSSEQSLWQDFKKRLSISQTIIHLFASGSYDQVFAQVIGHLKDLKPDQLIYLSAALNEEHGNRHIGLIDTCGALIRNQQQLLKNVLTGQIDSLGTHLFHAEVFHHFDSDSLFLGPFSFRQQYSGQDLRRNGFGTAIFRNLADFLKQSNHAGKTMMVVDISPDGWTLRRTQENFKVFKTEKLIPNATHILASIEDASDNAMTSSSSLGEFPMHTLSPAAQSQTSVSQAKGKVIDNVGLYIAALKKPENFSDLSFFIEDWILEQNQQARKSGFLFYFKSWVRRSDAIEISDVYDEEIYEKFLKLFNKERKALENIYNKAMGKQEKIPREQISTGEQNETVIRARTFALGEEPQQDSLLSNSQTLEPEPPATQKINHLPDTDVGETFEGLGIDQRQYVVKIMTDKNKILQFFNLGEDHNMSALTNRSFFQRVKSISVQENVFLISLKTKLSQGQEGQVMGFALVRKIPYNISSKGEVSFQGQDKRKIYVIDFLGDRSLLDARKSWTPIILQEILRKNLSDSDIHQDAKGILLMDVQNFGDNIVAGQTVSEFLVQQGFQAISAEGLSPEFAARLQQRNAYYLSRHRAQTYWLTIQQHAQALDLRQDIENSAGEVMAPQGGVDFTSFDGFEFHRFSPDMPTEPVMSLPELQNIDGLDFFIIHITPILNFNLQSFFNGISDFQFASR